MTVSANAADGAPTKSTLTTLIPAKNLLTIHLVLVIQQNY